MSIFGTFSFKKSAFPWGLFCALISLMSFTRLRTRYPSVLASWPEISGAFTIYLIGLTGLAAALAAFLTLISEEEEPPVIFMISDGFRLAFVYGAPALLIAGAFGHLFPVAGGRSTAAGVAAVVLRAVINGFVFALVFHLIRKTVVITARARSYSLVAMAFPLIFAGLTGHSLFRVFQKARTLDPTSVAGGVKTSVQPRKPVPGVYEDFDSPPRVVIEDGRGGYYVGGFFKTYAGHPVGSVVRIDGTGVLDRSFTPHLSGETVTALVLSPQGNIYGIAYGTMYQVSSVFKISGSGTLDASFSSNAKAVITNGNGAWVSVFPDGRLLLSGSFKHGNRTGLVCLLADGRPDEVYMAAVSKSFGEKDGSFRVGQALALPSGGALVHSWRGLQRLRPDGSLDPQVMQTGRFSPDGFTLSHAGDQVVSWANSRGSFENKGAEISRNSTDGWEFPPLQTPVLESLGFVVPGRMGELYAVFSSNVASKPLLRLQSNGAMDLVFRPNVEPSEQIAGRVNAVLPLMDGALLAGDLRVGPAGTGGRVGRLIRLKSDGTVDPSFWPTWR